MNKKEFAEVFAQKDEQEAAAFSPPPPSPRPSSRPRGPMLTDTTLAEKLEAAMRAAPVEAQKITRAASQVWNMDQGVILLTALHQLAACPGRFHRWRRGILGLAAPFSLVICSRHRVRDGFLDYLAEPWLKQVRLLLRYLQASGQARLEKEVREGLQSLAEGPSSIPQDPSMPKIDETVLREQIEGQVAHLHQVLHPHLVVRSPLPSRIVPALSGSYDRVVMSMAGGLDPAAELLNAGKPAIAELCSLLAQSWQDMDLPLREGIPRRGVIHLLWRTNMRAARQLVCGRRSPWCATPPPVLLIRQNAAPGHLAPVPEPAWGEWEECLQFHYNLRSKYDRHEDLWELSDEARQHWGEFHHELLADPEVFAPFPLTFFDWIPELMLRLAMRIMPDLWQRQEESRKLVVSGEAAARARTVTWWLAHEHLECLRALLASPTHDELDGMDGPLGTHLEDGVRLESAILARLQKKGPLTPRELSRSFHKLNEEAREKTLGGLITRKLVVRTPEGKLALPTVAATNEGSGDASATPLADPPMKFPRQAIWKNADADVPMTITKLMGEQDGMKYYQAASGTGIPAHELTFLD